MGYELSQLIDSAGASRLPNVMTSRLGGLRSINKHYLVKLRSDLIVSRDVVYEGIFRDPNCQLLSRRADTVAGRGA